MLKVIFEFVYKTLGLAAAGLALLVYGSSGAVETGMSSLAIVGLLLVFASPVIAFFWVLSAKRKLAQRRALEKQRLVQLVGQHRSALNRSLQRAVKVNDYGITVVDGRDAAVDEFLCSFDFDPALTEFYDAKLTIYHALNMLDAYDQAKGFDANNIPFDGHDFERWVANSLNGFGWDASVTIGSGDQGIDVVAEKNGQKIGIQCKLHSSAIGNKAVQEAHAGKAYYALAKVAVLSNAPYTSSAKDLAISTDVLLLSHHDIPNLYEKAFG